MEAVVLELRHSMDTSSQAWGKGASVLGLRLWHNVGCTGFLVHPVAQGVSFILSDRLRIAHARSDDRRTPSACALPDGTRPGRGG